jgi:hypothetical protein
LPDPGRAKTASPSEPYTWRLPGEAPGTLAEIFAAEDSRAQNLVLSALRDANGFRRCAEAIGIAANPYDLIGAVMGCISVHLHPMARLADIRRRMRLTAQRARGAAAALQEFSSSMDQIERAAWLWRLKDLRIPDPTDPRVIRDLRNLAAGLDSVLARGAFKDRGGRSKMAAFDRLLQSLARVFEDTTGERATLTYNPYGPRYEGRFWEFVEIVRPIAAAIIAKSRVEPLAEPKTDLARGKFIERALARTIMDKTSTG